MRSMDNKIRHWSHPLPGKHRSIKRIDTSIQSRNKELCISSQYYRKWSDYLPKSSIIRWFFVVVCICWLHKEATTCTEQNLVGRQSGLNALRLCSLTLHVTNLSSAASIRLKKNKWVGFVKKYAEFALNFAPFCYCYNLMLNTILLSKTHTNSGGERSEVRALFHQDN